jgi:hypothetical protein
VTKEEDPEKKVTLTIRWTDYAAANLAARVAKFRKLDQFVEIDGRTGAIQFLRGVSSRASFMLPSLYAQIGSRVPLVGPDIPHWKRVQAANIEYSSMLALSLCCRAVFDERSKRMTAKRFADLSDTALGSVADYWADSAKVPVDEAAKALKLLRSLFQRCARPSKLLLDGPSLLEKRVGLLKFHADRQGAHTTLEPYLFDLLDLVHATAAIAVVGAMIIDFDAPWMGTTYMDSVDEGGWQAAKATFPALPGNRLFANFAIHQQAKAYWNITEFDGLEMLLNQLPAAIGYWDSTSETDVP